MPMEDALPTELGWLRVENAATVGKGLSWTADVETLATKLCALGKLTRYRSRVFVAGSDTEGSLRLAERIGIELADTPISAVSAGGGAAVQLCMGLCSTLDSAGLYGPERALFVYRRLPDEPGARPPRPLPSRYGTVQYSALTDKDELRRELVSQSVAALIIAGGRSSEREARMAIEAGLPVVAVAASGGAARRIWEDQARLGDALPGVPGPDGDRLFRALNSTDDDVVVEAAATLVELASR